MPRNVVTTEAFVLRTVDYGDNHVIVTLLARDLGKVSAIARAAKRSRKRFGGTLLPLRGLRATLSFRPNRDMAELDEAMVARDFVGIEASFDKITVASYATELLRAYLRDGDPANEALELLDDFYGRLCDCDDERAMLRTILCHFELGVLRIAGAAPSLNGCGRCGLATDAMERLRCSRDGDGLVCQDCVRPGERWGVIDAATLEALQYYERPEGRPPDAVANDDVAAQARRVLDASLETIIDCDLRSRAMLDDVLAPGAP